MRHVEKMLDYAVRSLLVVEDGPHLVRLQVLLECGDVAGARLGIVHDGKLQAIVAHLQLQRIGHVAENRFGCRDRVAGIFAAKSGNLLIQRVQRSEECFQPCRVIVLVDGIGRDEGRSERLRDRRHRRGIVPKVRIVPGFTVHEAGGGDCRAPSARRHLQQFLDPGVVIGAVVDDDLRGGDLPDDGGRDLEQMRVLVGIAQDAHDRNPVAADLSRNVAVEILRRDDRDLPVRSMCRRQRGHKSQRHCDKRLQGGPRIFA